MHELRGFLQLLVSLIILDEGVKSLDSKIKKLLGWIYVVLFIVSMYMSVEFIMELLVD